MYGAGKRTTRPPDRYSPSDINSPAVLPQTDFDLTMTDLDDTSSSLTGDPSLSLQSLNKKIQDVCDVFNQKMEAFTRKFSEIDERFDELCHRVDEIDTDLTKRITEVKAAVHNDYTKLQNNLSLHQQNNVTSHKSTINESMKHTNSIQRILTENLQRLTDRVSAVEGQAARLAALENTVHNITLSSPPLQTITQSTLPQPPQDSFNNVLTSTGISHSLQPNDSLPTFRPNINVSIPNNTQSDMYNSSNLSNTSGITLDYTRIPTYDGTLSPMHPEEFIDKVDQYFLIHPVPDQVKINLISEKLVGKARLWYTTLIPPPAVYKDFLSLFRNHFWSTSQQRAIRNDLYRPHFHRDYSSMQEHAMDWISRARYLQPPIDQTEMVDQIISHFSYNISLALRGLRINTTNELIQQLSYLQHAHNPSNNQSVNSSRQNTNNNFSGQTNQNRVPRQNNNYDRLQYNSNTPRSSQPDPTNTPQEN